MTRLLHLEASPKGELSTSSKMATAFLDEYKSLNPDITIKSINVFDYELPEFGKTGALSKFAPLEGRERTAEEAELWTKVEKEIQLFDAADRFLISCPMWNYGIPYKLKHYFDIIVQPGVTLGFDEEKMVHVGLLKNRPAKLLVTRSSCQVGDYADFQMPYLRYILHAIGINEVSAVIADQTFAFDPEQGQKYVDVKVAEARQAAASFPG